MLGEPSLKNETGRRIRYIKRRYIHKALPSTLELELEEGSSCGDGISFDMQRAWDGMRKIALSVFHVRSKNPRQVTKDRDEGK